MGSVLVSVLVWSPLVGYTRGLQTKTEIPVQLFLTSCDSLKFYHMKRNFRIQKTETSFRGQFQDSHFTIWSQVMDNAQKLD